MPEFEPILLPGMLSALFLVGLGLYLAMKRYPVFMASTLTATAILLPFALKG